MRNLITAVMDTRWRVPFFACLLGVISLFSPTLFSGLNRIQTDVGDTRLVNYHLEYGYRWMVRAPAFERLWSPPFYHPERNTAGYGDVEFASLPLYAPWRLLGCEPDTAFQLWLISAAIANFAAAILVLHKGLEFPPLASTAGAYIIAFGASRANALNHPQLFSIYYPLLALFCLSMIFSRGDAGSCAPRWLYLAALALTAQCYCGFYVAWFTVTMIGLAAAVAMLHARSRDGLLSLVRGRLRHLLFAGALAALLLLPLALSYADIARKVGVTRDIIPGDLQPRWASWFYPGPESWLYRALPKYWPFRAIPAEGEHRIGIGLAALALAIWGLWKARSRLIVALFATTAIAVMLLATRWPGEFSLWESFLARVVPGLGAIRAPVRIGALLSIPLGVGVACALQGWRNGRPWQAAGFALLLGLALEERVTTRSFNKLNIRRDVAAVAAAVPPDCKLFLFAPDSTTPFNISWKYHNDAMWASARLGVPTVNGQAGRIPPTWFPFNNVDVTTPEQRQALMTALRTWSLEHRIDPGQVCMIEGSLPMNW